MIAALAGSKALFRLDVTPHRFHYSPEFFSPNESFLSRVLWLIYEGSAICVTCLHPPTIAVFLLRLRPPRAFGDW
jgi:hypothetical protein